MYIRKDNRLNTTNNKQGIGSNKSQVNDEARKERKREGERGKTKERYLRRRD